MSDRDGGAPSERISALANLPEAYFVLAPELDSLALAEESRADCSNCVMLPPRAGHFDDGPWVFHPDSRCCTFHPSLANFLVGRALLGGATSAGLIRARMRSGIGVEAGGIRAPDGWREHYQRVRSHSFGRDPGLRCPYWVGGDHTCGIWPARPATCRTWYCKHDQGHGGAVLWSQLRIVLSRIRTVLANHCVEHGDPPEPVAAGCDLSEAALDAWSEWYRGCARTVERLTAEQLAAMDDANLADERMVLRAVAARKPRTLPDVVVPAVRDTVAQAHGIRVSGYSTFDSVVAPRSLFRFLSRLDGTRTWREARRDETGDEGGEGDEGDDMIDEATVAELYRVGALERPGEPDPAVVERQAWPGNVASGASDRSKDDATES